MRYSSLEHALSIAHVYFTLKPTKWLYEPKNEFKIDDKKYVWSPDIVMAHNGKLWVGEVQLTPLSAKNWSKKWNAWNLFFKDEKLYSQADFQKWVKNAPIKPHFFCITKQEKAAEGFNIKQRELKVLSNIAEL